MEEGRAVKTTGLNCVMFWIALILAAGACIQFMGFGLDMPIVVPLAFVAVGLWLATAVVYAFLPEAVLKDRVTTDELALVEGRRRKRRLILTWFLPLLALLLFELMLHGGHGDGATTVHLHVTAVDAGTASPIANARVTAHVEWREWDPSKHPVWVTDDQGRADLPVMVGAALYGGWMWRATTYSPRGHTVRVQHDGYETVEVSLGDQSVTHWRYFGWPRKISIQVPAQMERAENGS
jgi:hypothetical protein